MDVSTLIFKVLGSNPEDVVVIERCVGGLPGVLKLKPQLEAVYTAYQAGGVQTVLASCGPNIQAVIETIGPANVAAICPALANILKTVQAK